MVCSSSNWALRMIVPPKTWKEEISFWSANRDFQCAHTTRIYNITACKWNEIILSNWLRDILSTRKAISLEINWNSQEHRLTDCKCTATDIIVYRIMYRTYTYIWNVQIRRSHNNWESFLKWANKRKLLTENFAKSFRAHTDAQPCLDGPYYYFFWHKIIIF